MKTIQLEKIIHQKKLNKKALAVHLFPGNKHANLALNRVIKGDGFLDSNQISLLSELTNIPIGELYTGNEWEASSKNGLMFFKCENYTAELDTKAWTTKVFHKGSLFHESVIHNGAIALSVYFKALADIVGEHLKSNQL